MEAFLGLLETEPFSVLPGEETGYAGAVLPPEGREETVSLPSAHEMV